MMTKELNLSEELAAIQRQSEETLKIMTASGFVLDMIEWLTIKRYADKYGITQQVVVNWINRGTIPADAVRDIPELNNIRLVKDQPYK